MNYPRFNASLCLRLPSQFTFSNNGYPHGLTKHLHAQLQLLTYKDLMSSNLTIYYRVPAQKKSHRQVERRILEDS